MNWKRFTSSLLAPLCLFVWSIEAQSQDLTPWTAHPYGNEWINYSKKYVRVGVPADGVYKISLSALNSKVATYPGYNPATDNFTKDNVQIWHRGKEVAVISTDNNEVVFYGLKNDGASDGLMFRPGPEARLDKTTSFYSQEGSYFFTVAANPKRSAIVDGIPAQGTMKETYHIQTVVRNNSTLDELGRRHHLNGTGSWRFIDFAFGTRTETSSLNNSYFETPNAFVTNIASPGNKKVHYTNPSLIYDIPTEFREQVSLTGFQSGTTEPVRFEYALHGNGDAAHRVIVSASGTDSGLFTGTKVLETRDLTAFGSYRKTDALLTLNEHFLTSGVCYIGFKTAYTTTRPADIFGFSYFAISYPQKLDMQGKAVQEFNFKNNVSGKRQVEITNVASDAWVYDITNRDSPILISNTVRNGTTLSFDINRVNNQAVSLLVVLKSSGVSAVETGRIYNVGFGLLYSSTTAAPLVNGVVNPEAYDYLVVTHTSTEKNIKDQAIEYAKYRASQAGGAYRVLTIDMRNIFDQFNYGEPSPLAIGRFTNYMIKSGVREKHHLLLIGHSVSDPANVQVELPYEVPTYGDPGSDALLVSGLSNSPYNNPDVPAIPVGRITALTGTHVTNYLNKVIEYENQTSSLQPADLNWRKKVLHVVGAKRSYELNDFKGYFSGAASKMVNTAGYPWNVVLLSNDAAASSAVTSDAPRTVAPIETYVNEGVGAISYFGHGDQSGTIYNLEDPTRAKFTTTNRRYPFLYITGCGVGNVFSSHTVITMATNWLVTANKGGVAMMANSFKAYVSTANNYMSRLYERVFVGSDAQRKTLGQIWVNTAYNSVTGLSNGRLAADVLTNANVHQTNIYGDPALNILTVQPALPVVLKSFSGRLFEGNKVLLEWETSQERNSDRFEIERSRDGKTFELLTTLKSNGDTDSLSRYSFIDAEPTGGINYYRLKQLDKGADNTSADYSNIIAVEVPGHKMFTVYPNPTKDRLRIKVVNPAKVKEWKLYGVGGKLMLSGNTGELDIQQLAAGIYILEITSSTGELLRQSVLKQ